MDISSWWPVIAAIAAVIIIPVTIILRKRKVMAYRVISNIKVLSVQEGEDVKGRVQILFDNRPVSDVYLVVLRIWNAGNTPIERADYDKRPPTDEGQPICIDFGTEAKILEVEVVETSSTSIKTELQASLKFNGGSMTIDPILLNQRDFIQLKVLITNFKGEINLENNTRIIGASVRNWNRTTYAKIISYRNTGILLFIAILFFSFFIAGFMLSIIYTVISIFISLPDINTPPRNTGELLLFIITVIMIFFIALIITYAIYKLIEKIEPTIWENAWK